MTPRIEELVKELRMVANMINLGEKIRWGQETALMDEAADALEALTQAHQAGIDEAIADYQTNYEQKHIAEAVKLARDEVVEVMEKARDRYGTDGNSHCEIDECPTCQWNIGAKWGSNKALDDTIKALQDNK